MIRMILLVRNLSFKFLFAVIALSTTNIYAQEKAPDVAICPAEECFCYVVCNNGRIAGYARGERYKSCSKVAEDDMYAKVGCKDHGGVKQIKCGRHIYPPTQGGPEVTATAVPID
jgi:hypothetical protein